MPTDLSKRDDRGIRWLQIRNRIRLRCRYEFGTELPSGTLERVALCHALDQEHATGLDRREHIEAVYDDLVRWHQDVYLPSHARLMDILYDGAKSTLDPYEPQPAQVAGGPYVYTDRTASWIRRTRARCEPAYTDSLLTAFSRAMDLERAQSTISLARAMHEEDSDNPTVQIPTSLDELIELFDFLCVGRDLLRVTSDGQIVLQPLAIKSALDAARGRDPEGKRAARRSPIGPTISLDGEDCREPSEAEAGLHVQTALDALVNIEDVEVVRTVIHARRAKATRESARWWVLDHFLDLHAGEITFAELAALSGFSDSGLNEAYLRERGAIWAEIRAA
jgi:hypothetical protein